MKMKSSIASIGVLGFILAGCSSTKLKHVDAETFLRYAEPTSSMTLEFPIYIGSSHDNVYLEFQNYVPLIRTPPVTTVYWTELDSLPSEISEMIKSGHSPWVPFDHKEYEKAESGYVPIDLNEEIFAKPKQ